MRLIDADALIAEWYKLNNIGPEDCGARFVGYQEIARLINNALTVQPTGDLISRADAIEAVGDWMQKEYGYLDLNRAERLIDALSALPSAEAVTIHEGGTLEVKVPNAHKVGRVLVVDTDSHIGGGLFYPDDAVQGEWLEIEDYNGDYHYQCSVCKDEFYLEYGTPKENGYAYCPSCGARMYREDGEV